LHQVGDFFELKVKLRCQKVNVISAWKYAGWEAGWATKQVTSCSLVEFYRLYEHNASIISID